MSATSNAAEIARRLLSATPQYREAFRQLVAAEMRRVADEITAGYKQGRPGIHTGNLSRSVRGWLVRDSDGLEAIVAPTEYHAYLVEFGTNGDRVGKKGTPSYRGRHFGRMPPSPVVVPIRKRHRMRFRQRAVDVLERACEEIAR